MDCFGIFDCNVCGICIVFIRDDEILKCNCLKGWMGVVCEKFCKFGILISDYICVCDKCYNGVVCDMLCFNYSF